MLQVLVISIVGLRRGISVMFSRPYVRDPNSRVPFRLVEINEFQGGTTSVGYGKLFVSPTD